MLIPEARNLPIHCRTVVCLREHSGGKITKTRGIVLGTQEPSDFSRAYGRQVYVGIVDKRKSFILVEAAYDLWPIGKAKRIPSAMKTALVKFKTLHETR